MNTTLQKLYVAWSLSGDYYDSIMNGVPNWVTDDTIDDWFYSQLGM